MQLRCSWSADVEGGVHVPILLVELLLLTYPMHRPYGGLSYLCSSVVRSQRMWKAVFTSRFC